MTQALLAAVLACAVAAVCVLEGRSPLAQALGAGRPWSAWLSLSEGSRELSYLVVYWPQQRVLNLVYVPKGPQSFAGFPANLPRFAARNPKIADQEEPAQPQRSNAIPEGPRDAAADAAQPQRSSAIPEGPRDAAADAAQLAKDWLLGLPGLRRLPEGAWHGLSRFDRWLLALELMRLQAGSIRPAWLSEEAQTRDWHLDLLLRESPAPGRGGRPLTAEVLNGSGKAGLASQGKKILRLRGVDVVATGNLDVLQARTIVYDRTGRYEDAETVRRMLGCPSAAAVTRIDLKRLVDVSVTLADDCPLQ